MSTSQAVRSKDSGKPKKAVKKSKRPAPKREEPPPVASGRFVVAFFIIAALALVPATLRGLIEAEDETPVTNTAAWQVGQTETVYITLVTADYNRLLCASTQTFDGKYCEYEDEKKRRPKPAGAPVDDNKDDVIQPYRTWPDNKLVLVSGLWATPALATREHSEPSRGMSADKLARFTAKCEVRFIGKMNETKLRWQPGQKWAEEGSAMVGDAKSCTILPPDEPFKP